MKQRKLSNVRGSLLPTKDGRWTANLRGRYLGVFDTEALGRSCLDAALAEEQSSGIVVRRSTRRKPSNTYTNNNDGTTSITITSYKSEFTTIVDTDAVPLISGYKWRMTAPHETVEGRVLVYFTTKAENRIINLHRLLAGVGFEKADGTNVVDHIDRNTLNNRRNNLRVCSIRENVQNSMVFMGGVQKSASSYAVNFSVDGVRKYIGTFDDLEQAKKAYQYCCDNPEDWQAAVIKRNRSRGTGGIQYDRVRDVYHATLRHKHLKTFKTRSEAEAFLDELLRATES